MKLIRVEDYKEHGCPECGGKEFELAGRVPEEYTVVTCRGCGKQYGVARDLPDPLPPAVQPVARPPANPPILEKGQRGIEEYF